MKKILTSVSLGAILFIASSAMAGGAKMPKKLCLNSSSTNEAHQLIFKSAGAMAGPEGKLKTYTVTGLTRTDSTGGLISGSAYNYSSSMMATYSGKFGQDHVLGSYELRYKLETGEGDIRYRYDTDNGTIYTGEYPVESIDCDIFFQEP